MTHRWWLLLGIAVATGCPPDLSEQLLERQLADNRDEPSPTGIPGPTNLPEDLDQDQDGFMPESARDEFNSRFGSDPPFDLPDDPFGDCLDRQPVPPIVDRDGLVVDPATVHPDEPRFPIIDTPRDGVDSDCRKDNDFDADADAFILPEDEAAYLTYIEAWGYEDFLADWAAVNPQAGLTEPHPSDCDDDDPESWPGALDYLGDDTDQDCDGRPDTARFAFEGSQTLSWVTPESIEVARLANRYVLLVAAAQATLGGTQEENPSVAIPFDASAVGPAAPQPTSEFIDWDGSARSDGLSFDATQDPALSSGSSATLYVASQAVGTSDGRLVVSILSNQGGQLQRDDEAVFVAPGFNIPSTSVDLAVDGDGGVFSMSCSWFGLQMGHFDPTDPPSSTNAVVEAINPGRPYNCYFAAPPTKIGTVYRAPFNVCYDNWCLGRSLDSDESIITTNSSINDATGWTIGDFEMGELVLVNRDGTAHLEPSSGASVPLQPTPTANVVHADAIKFETTTYVALLTDDGANGRQVWLAHGLPGSFTYTDLRYFEATPIPGSPAASFPEALPDRVAVHADADRVFVAVTANDPSSNQDTVGWVFLGPSR